MAQAGLALVIVPHELFRRALGHNAPVEVCYYGVQCERPSQVGDALGSRAR